MLPPTENFEKCFEKNGTIPKNKKENDDRPSPQPFPGDVVQQVFCNDQTLQILEASVQ